MATTRGDEIARVLSTYIVQVASRMVHGPRDAVPQDEIETFRELRRALEELTGERPT